MSLSKADNKRASAREVGSLRETVVGLFGFGVHRRSSLSFVVVRRRCSPSLVVVGRRSSSFVVLRRCRSSLPVVAVDLSLLRQQRCD